LKYRAEIDGLRALAVVPVIAFHAGFGLFSGGFVGVDVFFVISGYLITTILIDDIENERFSIASFYERRARRILPALFFMMLACIPFAWMWMLPDQMKDFSQSLIAVSVFVSNILFWRESDYFAAAADEKPLLHTWSLAVEEQYYVLFPLFLFFAWRHGKNRVFWMIVVLAALSLVLSEWGWRNKATANFFLAPTRAWELLAGSIAAFVVQKRGVQSNNALSLLGLAAILFAIFVYDESTPFPSIYALVPVLGVVLLVLFADQHTFVARLLSTKLFVGIGLVSYSAYLWHQPLFAFASIRLVEEPSSLLMMSLSAASILLAIFTWRFVEQPFRNKALTSKRFVLLFSVIGASAFTILGFIGHKTDGFVKGDYKEIEAKLTSDIFVLGDSHAAHLVRGLTEITTGDVHNRTMVGCIPFRDVDRYDSRFQPGDCVKAVNSLLDEVIALDPDAIVILSTMGPVYIDGTTFKGKDEARVTGLGVELISDKRIKDRYKVFETGMRNTLAELSNLENPRIIFTIDVPELGIDHGCGQEGKVIELFGAEIGDLTGPMYEPKKASCYVNRDEYDERAKHYKALVLEVAREFPTVRVFNPTNSFCDQQRCTGYIEGVGYLYWDFDHLSDIGSQYYAEKFAHWFLEEN
jgi:peptidoglycan/LPS O-acetylase OafA/YrhL